MIFKLTMLLILGVWLLGVARPALAQGAEPASPEEPELESAALQVRGVLWNSYSQGANHPSDGINAFRGYDFADRKLKLDLLELDLQSGLNRPEQPGFRLDITAGYSMPRIDAAANLFRDPVTGQSATNFDIRQAYFSYTTDPGLRFDVGKFATVFGYEVMPGVDGLNPNATSSFSYVFSPYTHTGLRLTSPVSPGLTVTALAVTGADEFSSVNSQPSFGGQLAFQPSESLAVSVNYLRGPERYANDTDPRQLLEMVGTWQVTSEVKFGIQGLTGTERLSDEPGQVPYTANWNGLVLYMENRLTDRFALNLRNEWFNDPQGVRTGVAQNLRSFTISPTWNVSEDLVLRLDWRLDDSSQAVFDSRGRLVNRQPTLYFNQVLRF